MIGQTTAGYRLCTPSVILRMRCGLTRRSTAWC